MYKNALKEDLIRVVEDLDGTVESTDTIAKLKTKIEKSSTFESDADFVKTLIKNCIDERVSRNEREATLEKQKIELAKLQLAQLEKEVELQTAKNKALSLNPAAKVEEKQFETNIENMIKSIETLSLPVPTRSENFNLFFQSLQRAFLTKKINEEYKSEILINLLGERVHNVLLYIKKEELNDYEKLKSIVLREFQETATHIGIREAEDRFRPIDLAKECDIYISSRSGSLKDDIPVCQRARRLSCSEKLQVNDQIDDWLQQGIIKESVSDYCSPIVLCKKKDGNLRICIDYRKINSKTEKDRYPLPLIEEVLDQLQSGNFFSTIDLKNGFFHVEMEENRHIIEKGTIKPSLDKTKAVQNFPEPKNVKQVQSFRGLSGYFRKFIQNYSIIAKPLSDLLRDNAVFHFGPEQQLAFQTLRQKLSENSVLHIFKQGAKLELHTDASKFGYGAILLQQSDDNKHFPPYTILARKPLPRKKNIQVMNLKFWL
ncbi:retrovirus-related Pol polyprotein from transposon 297 [Trichonephila clavipes]|nr:retrovirus-related Pol polyprotein from transposon 297 [Trichonephila clavipes]